MSSFLQDLRFAVRVLAKDRAFTAVAVLTLAFALGANTAIFSVVNAVLLRPLPFADPGRLMVLGQVNRLSGDIDTVLSYPNLTDLKVQSKTLEDVGYFVRSSTFVRESGEPEHVDGAMVSASLLRLLGVKPELGRIFTDADDRQGAPRNIIISHALWKRVFQSDPHIVGRRAKFGSDLDNSWTVIGVMPEGFDFPVDGQTRDFYKAFNAQYKPSDLSHRAAVFIDGVARLRKGVSLVQARAELDVIGRRIEVQDPHDAAGFRYTIAPLQEEVVRGVRPALLLLLGAVAVVLLIGCANVANLLLARAAARRREMAIRAAVGATRGRIFAQLLVESVLLSVLAGACGTLLAAWALDLMKALAPRDIPRLDTVSLDPAVLGFTLALSVITGIVFGLAPALSASKTNLNETLKEGTRGTTEGRGRNRVRNVLVTVAVALSVVLLVGAGLLLRSFVRVTGVDPGFDYEHIALLEISARQGFYATPELQANLIRRMLQGLRALPGVTAAGGVDMLPLEQNERVWSFDIAGRPPFPAGQQPGVNRSNATPGYFNAMGIPLLRGRDIDEHDVAGAPPVVVVSQAFATRWFGGRNPVGQRIISHLPTRDEVSEIVGVVGDVRYHGLTDEPTPIVYGPVLQEPSRYMHYVVRAPSPAAVLPAMREVLRQIDRVQPVLALHTMADVRRASLAARRFNVVLLGMLSALALILAAVGIYSLMSYTVTQRTSEIGIRMALGAEAADVFRLIVGNALRLVGSGVAIGVVVAFTATRVMSSMVFGIGTHDPVTFTGICTIIVAVALVASWLPARRAARVDPLVAIRYD